MTRPLIRHRFLLSLVAVLILAACKKKEEPAGAPAKEVPAAPAAAAVTPFDLQSVPLTTTPLPPFPYIGLPSELKQGDAREETSGFERTYVLAGKELRRVEGKLSFRSFSMSSIQMSALGAHRNYEAALKELGATRVDQVYPADDHFVARNGGDGAAILKKLGVYNLERLDEPDTPGYEQYLIRTPSANVWISFFLFDNNNNVGLRVVEEKALGQGVAPAQQ